MSTMEAGSHLVIESPAHNMDRTALILRLVGEFDPSTDESFTEYYERLMFFFNSNGVTDENEKRNYFLMICGRTTYRLVRQLTQPIPPVEVPFPELILKIRDHLSPVPNAIIQRFHFLTRVQNEGETISQFIAALHASSEHCQFGNELSTYIRDRIVCGVEDQSLREKLFAQGNSLTYENAKNIALSHESATRDAATVGRSRDQVHRVREGNRQNSKASNTQCVRCGRRHNSNECAFRFATCFKCSKIGHISSVCKSNRRFNREQYEKPQMNNRYERDHQSQVAHATEEFADPYESECVRYESINFSSTENDIHHINVVPYIVKVKIDNVLCDMEVDSGCSKSVFTFKDFVRYFPHKVKELCNTGVILRTWTRQTIEMKGELTVHVQLGHTSVDLPLLVANCQGPNLLGRNWFLPLGIEIRGIERPIALNNAITESFNQQLKMILKENDKVFSNSLGCSKSTIVNITIKPDAQPKFFKPRPIAFALRERVIDELARLESEGVIESVKTSDWATPIVPVQKRDGTIRLCGDYSITINPVVEKNVYPLPTVDELLSKLHGCKVFTKLDLRKAYLQLPLNEISSRLLCINTIKGIYRIKRMPFGITPASSIFQRYMENLLAGIPGVLIYQDDLLIGGSTEVEHNDRLAKVLKCCLDDGLTFRKEKCQFLVDDLSFMGYKIDAQGISPLQNRLDAILKAPAPTSVTELRSFLGLINYYDRFLPNRSRISAPLYHLFEKNIQWKWTKSEDDAFEKLKQILCTPNVLVHYDPKLPIIVNCDASPIGVGAVLSHRFPDGRESPIMFASRSLQPAERNYAQIDLEALAIMFSLKKFDQFLFGRHFEIVTDHKPLLALFDPSRAASLCMSPRMLRWRIKLFAYDYTIVYKKGCMNGNADALSRLPLPCTETTTEICSSVLLIESGTEFGYDHSMIANATSEDPILSTVMSAISRGVNLPNSTEFDAFRYRHNELSIYKDCLCWGNRVVIPKKLRSQFMLILHAGHMGIVTMKSLARSYIWWPQIDRDISNYVEKCSQCQMTRNAPPQMTQAWPEATQPWQRVHIDFAGPIQQKYYLVVVDAFSRWLEIHTVSSTNAKSTIDILRSLFARFGLPETVVSDNGPPFSSYEYHTFLRRNGIKGITCAPYHPQSNGLAERYVQATKLAILRSIHGDTNLQLCRYLFAQRNAIIASVGKSPSEMMFQRRLRTHLSHIEPIKREKAIVKPSRSFALQETVLVTSYRQRKVRWVPATVTKILGNVMYEVRLPYGERWRRHRDQMRKRHPNMNVPNSPSNVTPALQGLNDEPHCANSRAWEMPHSSTPSFSSPSSSSSSTTDPNSVTTQNQPLLHSPPPIISSPHINLRRSSRPRRIPDYLKDYEL